MPVDLPAFTAELLFDPGAMTLLPAHECNLSILPVWIGFDLLATADGVSWCFDPSGRVPNQQTLADAWPIFCGASTSHDR